MGIKEKLSRLNLKKGSPEPLEEDDDAAPSGPVISGDLKGNGAALATVLRKNYILTSAVLLAVLVGSGAYFAYDISTGSSSGSADSTIKPVTHVNGMRVPTRIHAPIVPPVVPTASTQSTPVAATQSAAPAPLPPAPAPAPMPAAPSGPSPQQTMLKSMLSSSGTAVSWGSSGGAGTPAGAPPAPAAGQPATLAKPKNSVYSTHLVRKEVSPYELLQGTVIPATLETGIKSDLAGEITAVVNQPVYNSVSGAYVLIPAGSKLVGTYENKVIAGATRVGVAWTRILFPNGTYMQIGGMPGADSSGYSGFHDEVNDHTWTIFKNALLLSLIDVGMSVASPTSTTTAATTGVTGNSALQDGEQALAQTFGQAEAQMMQQAINIAPTITIRPGYAFNVMVTKDLVFPGPYQHGTQIAPTSPTGAAPATIPNPYG